MSKFSILVIDDNYSKVELVGKVIKGNLDCEIEYSKSTNEALKKLKDNVYDLLVVDMNLPQIIGDTPSITAGANLIEYIFKNNKVHKPLCIVGATSHSQAYHENLVCLTKYGVPLLLTENGDSGLKNLLFEKIMYYQQIKERVTPTPLIEDKVSGIECPDKVTLIWLAKHVDLKHWVGALLLLGAVFSFGVKMSETTFVKQVYGISSEKTGDKQSKILKTNRKDEGS